MTRDRRPETDELDWMGPSFTGGIMIDDLDHADLHPYPMPTSFQLAMIAATLSKGENPVAHLDSARRLHYYASEMLSEEELSREFKHEYLEREAKEIRDDPTKLPDPTMLPVEMRSIVRFERSKEWDEAREYLMDRGYPNSIKKAKTFRKHLKKLIDRFSGEAFGGNGDPVLEHQRLRDQDTYYVPKKWLDVLIRETKKRKSAGTTQAHRTRRQNQASKAGK